MGMLILLALLIVPILEIGVFILIGGQIGVFPTLAMILVTAVIGTGLLRWQGFSLIRRIQTELNANRVPGRDLAHGAMLLVAGVLLLTPGFVTDAIGFLLFVPPFRDVLFAFLAARLADSVVLQTGPGGPGGPTRPGGRPPHSTGDKPAGPDVVDLDPDEFSRAPDPSSPWRDSDRS